MHFLCKFHLTICAFPMLCKGLRLYYHLSGSLEQLGFRGHSSPSPTGISTGYTALCALGGNRRQQKRFTGFIKAAHINKRRRLCPKTTRGKTGSSHYYQTHFGLPALFLVLITCSYHSANWEQPLVENSTQTTHYSQAGS